MLGFNSNIYDTIWKNSDKISTENQVDVVSKIDVRQGYSEDKFLELNFIKTLKFLKNNSKVSLFSKYPDKLSKDIDFLESNGIKIFGIAVKCNEELLYELAEMRMVRDINIQGM